MAGKARRVRHVCTECGKVGLFQPGEDVVCRGCGRPADVPVQATVLEPGTLGTRPPGTTALPAAPVVMVPVQDEPPTALAAAALVAGILAASSIWVLPICILFAVAAIACGLVALSRHDGDTGVLVMALVGVGLAVVALSLALFLWPFLTSDGSSYESGGSGSQSSDGSGGGGSGGGGDGGGSGGDGGDGGSSGGGGGDGGGSGGGGDGGGGGGGSGGGGGGGGGVGVDAGGGADTDVDAPAPVALLVGALLLGLAAWRRRA